MSEAQNCIIINFIFLCLIPKLTKNYDNTVVV